MTNTGNNNLQGQIVYSENDAKDSVENAYDKCEAGANDVGNVATLRQTSLRQCQAIQSPAGPHRARKI